MKHFVITVLFILSCVGLWAETYDICENNSQWVGKWEMEYTESSAEIPNATVTMYGFDLTFSLCSDYFAQAKFIMALYAEMELNGIRADLGIRMAWNLIGSWSDGEYPVFKIDAEHSDLTPERSINVQIKNEYYNGYRISSLQKAQLELAMEQVVKQNFTPPFNISDMDNFEIGKRVEAVCLEQKNPYLLLGDDSSCRILSIDEVPYKGLVRAVRFDKNKSEYEVGLFARGEELIGLYTRTFSDKGEEIRYADKDRISDNEKRKEDLVIYDYHDKVLSPENGVAEYFVSKGNFYNGEWKDHTPCGKGVMRIDNLGEIEGEWVNGSFVRGTGNINYTDQYKGFTYSGEINKDFNPDGKGTLKNNDLEFEANGEFIKGSFSKGSVKIGGILLEGTFKLGTFDLIEGKCINKERGGSVRRSGFWEDGKLMDGQIQIDGYDNDYSTFSGEVKSGMLTEGKFICNGGYDVSRNWRGVTGGDAELLVEFSNGDKMIGIWNVESGYLCVDSNLEYVWADGNKVNYVVAQDYKLKKASYFDADGNASKSKTLKDRMVKTTGNEQNHICPISLEKVLYYLGTAVLK